jgi:hypothetical protein
MDVRYPVYAQADITIESREVLHEIIVEEILDHMRMLMKVGMETGS